MKFNSRLKIFGVALVAACLQLTSCTPLQTFEKDTIIPKSEWKSGFEAKGSFTVTDTAATYVAYIVLRHTDAYKYNNIWLNVGIQVPADTMRYQKLDLQLGTDAGGWIGSGMNDIWEIRQMIATRKLKKGSYNFTITQIMRDDPLPAVMSAGLRLEKQ